MPPKKKFTREQIIDAAFEIAKKEGLGSITIRKIANALGSSIAPIYVNFNDVDELLEGVMLKIHELTQNILLEQNTGYPFLDIGIASLKFAKEYDVLFKDLVFQKNDQFDVDMEEQLVELMKTDPDLKGFSTDELKDILLKLKIFQTGLSLMVANGLLSNKTDEQLIEMLMSMGNDVIVAKRQSKGVE
ncbi:TetR/AcrR family transcriptional regulator [Anaerobacillus alkaliphilus]|uniref:TetR/AcrR family transcriptional regulator n=1 Tax=Anaerobacillus alkaliphilus TaxID=1548597 RepID=A0A4Q0VN77_9BACI|nr:TetR family transcriptional regulator [Anaerobacillus alkaliphilus]RXI96593.1 TetR/AcrR family transcriptional regulator [Anaerobacillus alkaliphilus]